MGKLFTQGWYDRVEALLALARSNSSSILSSDFWVNVVTQAGVDNTFATDAGAPLTTAFAAIAAAGRGAYLPDGDYKFLTTARLASNLPIFLSPKAALVGVLPPATGNPNNAIFDYPQTTGAGTTLTAPSTFGSPVIAVASTAGMAPGIFLELTSALNPFLLAGPYKIRRIAGLNVTLDRPVRQAFLLGDVVTVVTPLQNCAIYGNGALMTGTGDRYVEIFTGWHCYVADLVIDGSAGMISDTCLSFDNPCFSCVGDNLQVDGAGLAPSLVRNECGEADLLRDCVVQNAAGAGILLGFSVSSRVENCAVSGCAASGFNFQAGPMSGCTVTGGSSIGNGIGILIADSVNTCTFTGMTISHNVNDGVRINGTGPSDNKIIGCPITANGANGIDVVTGIRTVVSSCDLTGNVGAAIFLDTTSTGTALSDLDVSGGIGLQCRSDCVAEGLRGVCTSNTLLLDSASSDLRLSGSDLRPTGQVHAFEVSGTGAKLDIVNTKLVLPVNGTAIVTTGGAGTTVRLENFTASGGAGRFGLFAASAGSRIQCGANVDVTGCSNAPIVPGGAGVVTLEQTGAEFLDASATGTVTLSQTQAQYGTIHATGALTAPVVYNVPANVPGLRYIFRNATTNAFAASIGVTGTGPLAVAQGDAAWFESDGTTIHRITADVASP